LLKFFNKKKKKKKKKKKRSESVQNAVSFPRMATRHTYGRRPPALWSETGM